jgi:small subunit ribosomal protein S16
VYVFFSVSFYLGQLFIMALKIRLQRHGTSHRPFYRMVVTEANARRDGRFVEVLGTYEPQASRVEDEINLKLDRIDYWKSVGAKATDTAASLIRRANRESDGSVSAPDAEAIEQAVAKEAIEEPISEAKTESAQSEVESDSEGEDKAAEACSIESSETTAQTDTKDSATVEETSESES